MDLKFSLSQLKGKISSATLIVIVLIIFVILFGVAGWFTIQENISYKELIQSKISEYNDSKILVSRLKELKANSEYYIKQGEKYDEVIADADTYNPVDYYVEIDELCREFNLKIDEISVGELVPDTLTKSAKTTLVVTGEEVNVRRFASYIVSQKELARIDSVSMTEQDDGTVIAALEIVNFTK